MFKLLLKYSIGLIVLGLLTLVVLYFIYNKMIANVLQKNKPYGVFYSLQTQLEKYPEAQWPTVLKQLTPKSATAAEILPITQLDIHTDKKQELIAGNVVDTIGNDMYYFGYDVRPLNYYYRIANSQYALRLQELPISVVAQHTSAWLFHLLVLELQQTHRAQWPEKVKQLAKIYELPLTIFFPSDANIPQSIKLMLAQEQEFVLSNPDAAGRIKYIYLNVKGANATLRVGPIPYPLYIHYEGPLLILAFILLAIGFIIFLTYIFSRNLDKIYNITQQYSKGDFSTPPPISKNSTLRTLYENILQMGHKIQSLLQTQRNLTRFVAHECRTPVSTMLFAIDSLEQENLSEKARNNITSIKQDLRELNAMVGEFLSYARFSDQDLKLEYKKVDINLWLHNCVEKFHDAPKKITSSSTIANGICAEFDPNLMKHVLNNLINNALKYANTMIDVTLTPNDSWYIIHVDDDGFGIADADKDNIFAAFFRLDSSTNSPEKGFGLGLHIAETIIKLHKGNFTVSESALGGARFSFSWPIHK